MSRRTGAFASLFAGLVVCQACQQTRPSPRVLGVMPVARRQISNTSASAELRTMIDDGDIGRGTNRFRYSGHWEHVRGHADGRSLGTSSRSFHAGDSATIRFVGAQIRLYGVRGRTGGYAALALDARHGADMPDFYAPTVQPDSLVYVSPLLLPGDHTLWIAVSGRHDPRSKGDFVNIDHAAVTPPTTAARRP